jgi:hypothetical protein
VPTIQTVSFYIAMGPKYGKMLDIHGDDDDDDDGAIPTWFHFGIEQLAATLRQFGVHDIDGDSAATLQSNLGRRVYATQVLHRNKHLVYQSRQGHEHNKFQITPAARRYY